MKTTSLRAVHGDQVLSVFCELIIDCEHKTAPVVPDGYPSIRTPNIGRGRLLLDGVNRVSEETYREWTRRVEPRPGDLILAREAPVGNVARVPPKLKVCLGQRTVLIRPNGEKVNPDYLLYVLLGAEVQGQIHSKTNGVTVPHLNLGDIRSLRLPSLPDRQLQDKVASILSAYDDLTENNNRRIKILEDMAQALYREWFVNFRFPGHEKVKMVDSPVRKVPAGWEYCRIDELGVVGRGKSKHRPRNDPSLYGGQYPFFQTGDVKAARVFMLEHSQTYNDVGLAQSKQWSAGTLCITIAANIAETAVLGIDGCFPDSVVGVTVDERLTDVFLVKHQIDAQKEQMVAHSRGTTQDNLSLEKLLGFPFLKPESALLHRWKELVAPAMEQVRVLARKSSILRATRDLLLPKLISGEIDVGAVESG